MCANIKRLNKLLPHTFNNFNCHIYSIFSTSLKNLFPIVQQHIQANITYTFFSITDYTSDYCITQIFTTAITADHYTDIYNKIYK